MIQEIEFIRVKMERAQADLKAREQMEEISRSGTDEDWRRACALHPTTAGKAPTKAERIKEADMQHRIAAKCRREVEMFKSVLALLEKYERILQYERTQPESERIR